MQSSLFSPEKRLHPEVEMGILFFPMKDHLIFLRICILNWIALSGCVGFITRKGRSVLGCSLHRQACSVEWCRIERSISGMSSSTRMQEQVHLGECASGFTQLCAFWNVDLSSSQ